MINHPDAKVTGIFLFACATAFAALWHNLGVLFDYKLLLVVIGGQGVPLMMLTLRNLYDIVPVMTNRHTRPPNVLVMAPIMPDNDIVFVHHGLAVSFFVITLPNLVRNNRVITFVYGLRLAGLGCMNAASMKF